MQAAFSTQSRLSQVRTNELALSILGLVLLFACAQVSIPLNPVPITLQTVAVMLIGLTFSTRPALLAVALYLSCGAFGAPVFSGWSGGLLTLAGPSGGYLMGFFAAVIFMTTWRKLFRGDSLLSTLLNCAFGTSIILGLGVAWLSRSIGLDAAIQFGLIPFVIPGIIKAVLLSGSLKILRATN